MTDTAVQAESDTSSQPGALARLWALRPTLLDLGILTGFWLLFFWQILIRKDHLIPYDLIDQHYMFQDFIHRALESGQRPWWAPNILAGYPMVADPLSAIFYPPNLLMHLVVPGAFLPYLALEWQVALHYLWAAIGTYALARSLTGSRAGSILAALTFAFGAFFAMHMPHLSPISTLAWLPWILLAFRLALARHSLVWTGLGALAFGMMALAGHALTILQIAYLLAALTIVCVVRRWQSDRRGAVAAGLIGGTIVALGFGIAMIQLLPSWHLSSLTERAELTYAEATGSSYLPTWMLTALLPSFFSPDGPAPYWGGGDIAESNMYAGLLPLFLAGLALVRTRRADRPMVGLIAIVGLISLVLALGAHAWLYRIAFDLLPGIDRVRRPLNYIAFVHLALGLLAAYGVRALQDDAGDHAVPRTLLGWLRWGLIGTLVAVALAALALANAAGTPAQEPLMLVTNGLVFGGIVVGAAYLAVRARLTWGVTARATVAVLILIAAIDLGSAMAGTVFQHHEMEPDSYIGTTWAGNPGDPVVPELLARQEQALPDRARYLPARAGSIWANGPLVWDLESADGYSVLWPGTYQALFNAAKAAPNTPLFDVLSARYIIAGEPLDQALPGASEDKFRPIHDGSPSIYENPSALPRVWVARDAVYAPGGNALAYMQEHPERLRDTVVLSEPPPGEAEAHPTPPGSAEITRYENTKVDIRVSMDAPGFVVLADSYYPGWTAYIAGTAQRVYRADHAFRAVFVPAGEHLIEYRFSPPGLKRGAAASGLAGLATAGLVGAGLILSYRGRRRA